MGTVNNNARGGSGANLENTPVAYISRVAEGSLAISGDGQSIIVSDTTLVVGGEVIHIDSQTLTPDLPSRVVVTITDGVSAYPAQMQHGGRVTYNVANASGGAVSGNILINGGLYEGGYGSDETLGIVSVSNGSSSNTERINYFYTVASHTVTGTLGNAGVTITGTESQFRGYIKAGPGGISIDWDNTFAADEVKLGRFEVTSAGITLLSDQRIISPISRAQRIGSEVVDWSGGIPEGPKDWGGNCIYNLTELLNGDLLISGNGALCSIFDGAVWGTQFVPSDLLVTDHISACLSFGREVSTGGDEIVYFGTYTGKLRRWNRTKNTYTTISVPNFAGIPINKILKVTTDQYILIIGGNPETSANFKCYVVVDNGTSAPNIYDYTANIVLAANSPTTTVNRAAYVDGYVVMGGKNSSGMFFGLYVVNHAPTDLSAYLPGTAAQKNNNGTSGSIRTVSASGDGRVLLAGMGGAPYVCEWNLRQTHARGRVRVTTSTTAGGFASFTLPGGFMFSNGGTQQFRARYASYLKDENTAYEIEVEAVDPGQAGMAALGAVNTKVDTEAKIVSVTNLEAIGMGRLLGHGHMAGFPHGTQSSSPLGSGWDGYRWIVVLQSGDVITYENGTLKDMSYLYEFKGRAVEVAVTNRAVWLIGDHGRIFSVPK